MVKMSTSYMAAYWKLGYRIEEEYHSLDAALERLWDLWCAADGKPIEIKDSTGRVIADEAFLNADRMDRINAQ